MNRSEELAATYLDSLGLGSVIHEPDGGIPPDFVVDGRIAVEVRRLNQNFEAGGAYEGLENIEAALMRFVEKVLPRFGPAPDGKGWWVFFDFRRPLDAKAVKRNLPKVLAAFQAAPSPGGADIQLTRTFRLEIRPASISVAHHFMLGGYCDFDAGGFVAGEIIRNLNLCITEKAAKIAPYRDRYPEWWLVLPDHIGPDLDMEDRASVRAHIDLSGFSRVVLLHPRAPTSALVLCDGASGEG